MKKQDAIYGIASRCEVQSERIPDLIDLSILSCLYIADLLLFVFITIILTTFSATYLAG